MCKASSSQDLVQRIQSLEAELGTSREMNERLAGENRRLSVLMNTLPYPTMRIRRDRTVLWANRVAREVGARVGGLCWRDFGHAEYIPEEHKVYIREHGSVPPGGTCCTFCLADQAMDAQAPANDPEVEAFQRVWDTHWLPMDEETYLHYALDVTERKLGEETLRQSEQRFRALAENATDVIAVLDHRYRFTYINPAVERLSGYTVEEAMRLPRDRLFTPESVRRIQAAMAERRASLGPGDPGRSAYRVELQHMHRNGGVVDVELVTSPLFNDAGEFTGILGVTRNVAERKREEEEKERFLEKMHRFRKAESLSCMAGAIAHQFNNQLSAVMGNLELAAGDLEEGSGVREYLSDAMAASRKCAEVCGLILTYLGQARGKKEPVDLSEGCRSWLPMLEEVVPPEASLETSLCPSGPRVLADARHIQQVLQHLVTNAAEALQSGRGTIRLSLYPVEARDIPEVFRFPEDWEPSGVEHDCLEVSDSGKGMPAESVERIFDPFFSEKFTGRGLGLPAVLGIVKAHGGGICVESEPGRGSTFRVFLPVSQEPMPAGRGRKQDRPEPAGGAVLLVEDQASVRRLGVRMLEHLGFEVLEAGSGLEAVERFREHRERIRCVLTDLTMPGMNGWETLAALRELRPDLPAVLVSGYEKIQAMAGDHREQPQAFLHKPYSEEELLDALGRALQE